MAGDLALRPLKYDGFKRLIDVLFSGVVLIVTMPVQALIGLVVRLTLGRPVLFRQRRPGKDERVFELVKFRTMRPPPPDDAMTDRERTTRFGSVLRSTSLDELPTLWNVVKGDMSLVGPRPLLVQYLDRYSPEQRRRHLVRPGITGLAQVTGRNATTWEDRLRLDVEYVDRRSLSLDLQIVLRTIRLVLRREGIDNSEQGPMPEFQGNERAGSP